MALYTLKTIRPPSITLQHHTFTFRIYERFTTPEGPAKRAIGELTFQKPAQEPWAAARVRFIAAVFAWLATYEEAHAITQVISTWLDTQEWTT